MATTQLKLLSAALLLGFTLSACDSGDDNDQGTQQPPTSSPGTSAGAPVSGGNNPLFIGVTDEEEIVQFAANNPSQLIATVALTGAQADSGANPFPVAADFRPKTGEYYILYSDRRIYTASSEGVLTLVGRATYPENAIATAFDFNPVSDTIRSISVNTDRGNFRVNPDTVAVTTDTAVTYNSADANNGATPAIAGVAYTGAHGASTTTAYAIDATQDTLVTLGNVSGSPQSPNGGQLFTVGSLGVSVGGGGGIGFDITSDSSPVGYLSDSGDGTTRIFKVNLATGGTELLGSVPKRLVGMAIKPGSGTGGTTPPPVVPPTTPPPATGGISSGDGLCTLALAGAAFTATVDAEDAGPLCLGCGVAGVGNLTDTDFTNFATFTSGLGLLLGTQQVTVAANGSTVFTPGVDGQVVGATFNIPGGDPLELALLPGVRIQTLLDGKATADEAVSFSSELLRLALAGSGIIAPSSEKFFAGFTAKAPFDAVRVTFDSGLVGLLTTVNMHYACASAPAGGDFPSGPIPLPTAP